MIYFAFNIKYTPAFSSYITEVQIKGKKTHNFLS